MKNIIDYIKSIINNQNNEYELKYLLNKSIKEKRDIFIVSVSGWNKRKEMGRCRQQKIIYDESGSYLTTNTGNRFEKAILSSEWLNEKFIEKEVEYKECYKQNSLDEWELVKE